jgi:hypothetical protein
MKKLTEQELLELNNLREEHYSTVYDIGDINVKMEEYNKLIQELTEEKTLLLGKYANILLKEQEMAKGLSTKYGEGQIDVDTGEIS